MDRTSLYVADDHPIYLEGLERALRERPEFDVVGTCRDGRSALADIKRLGPDVAILDENMPGLGGSEVLEAISQEGLHTRVVMLSASLDSTAIYRAVANGARAYLSKDSDRREICDAVAAVARGQTVLAPEAQVGLFAELRIHERNGRPSLSEREQQILERIADGAGAADIAADLHISTATVKTHLRNLYEKLGVSERAAAVAEAMRKGLLK
jgi:two-component system nitrate/nitrite response regulator NarL